MCGSSIVSSGTLFFFLEKTKYFIIILWFQINIENVQKISYTIAISLERKKRLYLAWLYEWHKKESELRLNLCVQIDLLVRLDREKKMLLQIKQTNQISENSSRDFFFFFFVGWLDENAQFIFKVKKKAWRQIEPFEATWWY